MKITLAILLVALVGCGSNFSSRVTFADAWDACVIPGRLSSSEFDTVVLVAEVVRDDGGLESEFVAGVLSGCQGANDFLGCTACFTKIAAAVWP